MTSGIQGADVHALPARGTVNKNVRPYKIGRGNVERINEFLKEGHEVVFNGFDTRTDLNKNPRDVTPVTLYIFTVGGERYGIKAEDVEFPN